MMILVALAGLVVGAIAGVFVGIAAGYVWVGITNPGCLGARCGDAIFFVFVPIGSLICAVAGAIILAWIVARGRAKSANDRRSAGGAS
jgi:hypothetical protein